MEKRKKRHDMSTIGGRIKYYREKAKLTQEGLAKEIHTTRQLVCAWEKNERDSYIPYIDDLCKIFGIDAGKLINGVSSENQTVSDELGLSNEAIEFLKSLKGDYYIPFTDTDSDELTATSIYEEEWGEKQAFLSVDVEGGYPDELKYIINLLLTNRNGKMILAMLAKFITIDFDYAFVGKESCWELEYNTYSEDRKKTMLPVSLMRYALLQAINSKLEELKIDVERDEE